MAVGVSTPLALAVLISLVVGGLSVRDYCVDPNGIIRPLNGEWIQGVQRCRCSHPQHVSPWGSGRQLTDARAYCLYNGCLDSERRRLLKSGATFTKNGHPCECIKGSSRYHTKTVRYHARCHDGTDYYEIIFD